MGVPELPELAFDEQRHIYSLVGYGINLPSVTGIMRPLSNAHYGGIDEDVLAAAAERGQAVHQAIENYLLFGIDDIGPEHGGYYSAFKDWLASTGWEIVATEKRIYHRTLKYAGTADLLCRSDDSDGLICVDIKTSQSIVDMLARVQTEAYARAFASHGARICGKAIVRLQRDGKWELKQYGRQDGEAWEAFSGLLVINNYMKKYGGK